MKLFINLLLTFTIFVFPAFAENKPQKTHDETVLLPPRKPSNNKPKLPSLIFLRCTYSVGYLSLEFPDDANYIEVTLSDEILPVWVGTITRSNPQAEIPALFGSYTITCRTDQNQIFEGTLQFNNLHLYEN